MEHLGAHAQGFLEGGGAVGHQHELLEIQAVGGVGATVDHVHQRHRQQGGHRAAQVAIQRQAHAVGGGPGGGHAHRQDGVCAQGALVVRAIQLDHRRVHGRLVEGAEAAQGGRDLLLDVAHGLEHALAHVAAAAVAQFVGLVGTGAGTARHDRPPGGAAFEHHLGFYRGRAAGIEHLPSHHGVDHEVERIDHWVTVKQVPGILLVPPAMSFVVTGTVWPVRSRPRGLRRAVHNGDCDRDRARSRPSP